MPANLSSLGVHLVGAKYPEYKFVVTSEWVKDYKKALGYSAAQIVDDSFVPQTFGAAFRDSEFAAFHELGIDLRQLLHTNQHQHFISPICVGDIILGRASIQRLVFKKSKLGDIVFIEFQNLFRRIGSQFEIFASGEQVPLLESVTTVVVRALDKNLPEAPNHIKPMGVQHVSG